MSKGAPALSETTAEHNAPERTTDKKDHCVGNKPARLSFKPWGWPVQGENYSADFNMDKRIYLIEIP